MFKTKNTNMKKSKLIISFVVMALLAVTLTTVALAHSSSYSMTIAGGDTVIYYGTHIYGDTGDDTYDISCDFGAYFESRAYCVSCGKNASDPTYIYSDEIEDWSNFDTDHSSNSHLIRCKIKNRDTSSDYVCGRYGLH